MTQDVKMIVAIGLNNEIGTEGNLIWPIREDLRHFKAVTLGHPVIMGRKTWESLPKRPLPGRRNIVVTRNCGYSAPGAEIAPSVEEAVRMTSGEEPFVIGGEQIYRLAFPYCNELHLTRIHDTCRNADAFFPEIDNKEWTETDNSGPLTADTIKYEFCTLRRNKK